ncbi:hypothetical protein K435DRAFT_848195 [Dendrothele bispora CBS 962.96]|uniref:ABM domain-containing protein n=1 Tax=Dendrothele bispora (strain CBS 962.96) TaxID=1314807 RepID=A0A4S8MVB8_DENBC|nr:hypothetical protein K435DRAFT_848195 [Dendrothele bispora CBS 962.96]
MNGIRTFFTPQKRTTTPSGKLLVVVIVGVKPGFEDKIAEALRMSKAEVDAGKEPKTLTYRMGRSVTTDGQLLESEFVVIEEYADAKVGLLEHAKGPGFAVLMKASEDVLLLVPVVDCVDINRWMG